MSCPQCAKAFDDGLAHGRRQLIDEGWVSLRMCQEIRTTTIMDTEKSMRRIVTEEMAVEIERIKQERDERIEKLQNEILTLKDGIRRGFPIEWMLGENGNINYD